MENMIIYVTSAVKNNVAVSVAATKTAEGKDTICRQYKNYDSRRATLAVIAEMVTRHPGCDHYSVITSDQYIYESYEMSNIVKDARKNKWMVDDKTTLPYYNEWAWITNVTGDNLTVVNACPRKNNGKVFKEYQETLNKLYEYACSKVEVVLKKLNPAYDPMPMKTVQEGVAPLTPVNASSSAQPVAQPVQKSVVKKQPVTVKPVVKQAPDIEMPVADDSVSFNADDLVLMSGNTSKFTATEEDMSFAYADMGEGAMIDPNFVGLDDSACEYVVVEPTAPMTAPVVTKPQPKVEEPKLEKPAVVTYYNLNDGFHTQEFEYKSKAMDAYKKLAGHGLLVFCRCNGDLQYHGIPADDQCFCFTNMKVFQKHNVAFKVEFAKKVYIEDSKFCKKIVL